MLVKLINKLQVVDFSGIIVGLSFFAFYKEFGNVDVLMAEALALLHGLHICYEQGLAPLVLEVY